MLETREIPLLPCPPEICTFADKFSEFSFRMGSFSVRQTSNLMENLITDYLLLADVAEKIPVDSRMGENMDPSILECGLAAYISLASW